MSSLVIEVEVLEGTHFVQAVEDARNLAAAVDAAYVRLRFNGAMVRVSRKSDSQEMLKEYERCSNENSNLIIG